VWAGAKTGEELAKRIGGLPGFGAMKVKILISVLAKKFGVMPDGWEKQAADWLQHRRCRFHRVDAGGTRSEAGAEGGRQVAACRWRVT